MLDYKKKYLELSKLQDEGTSYIVINTMNGELFMNINTTNITDDIILYIKNKIDTHISKLGDDSLKYKYYGLIDPNGDLICTNWKIHTLLQVLNNTSPLIIIFRSLSSIAENSKILNAFENCNITLELRPSNITDLLFTYNDLLESPDFLKELFEQCALIDWIDPLSYFMKTLYFGTQFLAAKGITDNLRIMHILEYKPQLINNNETKKIYELSNNILYN
jgi:hypothetical protein